VLRFNVDKYHKTKGGGVYLKYETIEEMTEEIMKEYNPSLLSVPCAIEYDDFLENYLGVSVDYQHIYSGSDQGDILGCALFSKQGLAVFDKEEMCRKIIPYEENTVVLDLSLVNGDRKTQENITGLHEGGHIWLHGPLSSSLEGQFVVESQGIICCRKCGIETCSHNGIDSEEQWREWQATTFAVTLALPRKSLEISVRDLFDKHGVDDKQLITDLDAETEKLALDIIPEDLKRIYNMSKKSIRYRLKKTGFYMTKSEYEAAHAQMTIFDFI